MSFLSFVLVRSHQGHLFRLLHSFSWTTTTTTTLKRCRCPILNNQANKNLFSSHSQTTLKCCPECCLFSTQLSTSVRLFFVLSGQWLVFPLSFVCSTCLFVSMSDANGPPQDLVMSGWIHGFCLSILEIVSWLGSSNRRSRILITLIVSKGNNWHLDCLTEQFRLRQHPWRWVTKFHFTIAKQDDRGTFCGQLIFWRW